LVAVQALLPIYVGSGWWGDWWMHYDESLVFLGQWSVDTKWFDLYTLASRTPLFNLVGAFLLSLGGEEFGIFQLASTLMNCCFLPALYLLLRALLGPRAGLVGIMLASLNIWMLHLAWFTWPKMLVVYFLLLSLYFYLCFLQQTQNV